ncbi:MAG: NADH-quinone oxidoreductase subunit N [Pseudomonadota bacterium]|nr:NADH-quinone oxidoreductase subunit N [Pseudomonadota bacterium]
MLFLPEATITFFIISTLLLGVSLPLQQRGTFSLAMTLVMTFFVICELSISPVVINSWQGWQVDMLSQCLKLFASLILFFITLINFNYIKNAKIKEFEYNILVQSVLLGVFVVCSANNFLILFIGLELSALPMYAIIAIFQKKLGLEASIKYFILGALASGFILFGISFCYGATGSIQFLIDDQSKLSILGMLFVTCGLLFKVGCAPFHNWVPDVYEGAPIPAVMLIATIPKLAYVTAFIRLGHSGAFEGSLQIILILCALLSMLIGNLSALSQTNTKRLLGYSSVAHMGYLILAIAIGIQGFSSAIFYIIIYTVATCGILGTLSVLSKSNNELCELKSLNGLHHKQPIIAFYLMCVIFSMASIPPLAGFIAKLNVLYQLYLANFIVVGVIAMLIAVIGIFYYIRVVRLLYFDSKTEATKSKSLMRVKTKDVFLLAIPVIFIVFNGITPSVMLNVAEKMIVKKSVVIHPSPTKKNRVYSDIEDIFKFSF